MIPYASVCFVLTALGITATAVFVREKLRAYSVKAVMLKTLASCMFLLTAICAVLLNEKARTFGCFVIAGQIFGLLGDVWLDLKYAYRNDDGIYTTAGFLAFASGHVMFIAGMLVCFADFARPGYIVIPVFVGICFGLLVVPFGKLTRLDYGDFKRISMFYGVMLFAVAAMSGSLAIMNSFGNTGLNLFFAGSVSFALSDLILSGTYFGQDRERPVDIILNYAFYYGAQFLIALSLLFI